MKLHESRKENKSFRFAETKKIKIAQQGKTVLKKDENFFRGLLKRGSQSVSQWLTAKPGEKSINWELYSFRTSFGNLIFVRSQNERRKVLESKYLVRQKVE